MIGEVQQRYKFTMLYHKKMEKIKSNKAYIILLSVLIIYLIITFFTLKNTNKKEENISYFVTNNSKYIFENNKFSKPENNNKLNWKEYSIYIDNNYIGNYQLQYNDKWYIYDKERNPIKYEGNVIGFSNLNINVYNFNKQDITDTEINKINLYLRNENINIVDYNTYDAKIEFDIDNDNKLEKIYIVTSRINGNDNNIFSMILMEKDNKITTISSKIISSQSNESIKIYDVYGIIDIDEDKTMEIIISETQYSQPDKSNEQIYKLKNKKYENITEK